MEMFSAPSAWGTPIDTPALDAQFVLVFVNTNQSFVLSICLVFGLSAQPLLGSPLASEAFEYVAGSVNGQSGGTGFAGPWTEVYGDTTNPLLVDTTPLNYPGLTTTGGSLKLPINSVYSDSQRALANPQSAGVFYFSAIGKTVLDAGMYLGIGLGGDMVDGNNYVVYLEYDLQNQKSTFNIKHEFDGESSPFYELPGTGVFFIVGRLTVAPGNDTLEIWVNPVLGSPPAGPPNVSLTGFDIGALTHVFIDGGGASSPQVNARLDEFKLGTSFNDVMPAGSGNLPPSITTNAAAAPSPVKGNSTALTVSANDDAGESGLIYTWSYTGGSPGSPVTFSQNTTNAAKSTTATFTAAGVYTFTVTVQDPEGLSTTSSVNVTVEQTPTSLTVAPANATVGKGDAQLFVATVRDQFNAAFATQPAVTWGVSGGGSIAVNGNFSANTVGGPFTVTATSGTANGTAAVTVTGETFTHWQTSRFTSGEITAGNADALANVDGDALANLLEYALGTDPRTCTVLPGATLDATGHLTLTLMRPKALPGVQYFGEATSALGSWPTSVPIEIITDGDPQTIRLTDPLSFANSAQRCLRLRATAPP
jgi:hypothetical protein